MTIPPSRRWVSSTSKRQSEAEIVASIGHLAAALGVEGSLLQGDPTSPPCSQPPNGPRISTECNDLRMRAQPS